MTARSEPALAPHRRAIGLSGGQVVVLDPWAPRAELRRLYDSLAGVLLPGGAGLAAVWSQHRRRDGGRRPGGWSELASADVLLARWALADGRPLLGICRGIQMMALAVGGHLDGSVPGHRQPGVFPAHRVEVAAGSRLGEVLGAADLAVNSRHHRAVRSLPLGTALRASAWAAHDGVVEGVEAVDHVFALGVQFHPENLLDAHEPSRRLFRQFVAACRAALPRGRAE